MQLKFITQLDKAGKVISRFDSVQLLEQGLLIQDIEPIPDYGFVSHQYQYSAIAETKNSGYIKFSLHWKIDSADEGLCNGFQSWTESKWFNSTNKIIKTMKINNQNMVRYIYIGAEE